MARKVRRNMRGKISPFSEKTENLGKAGTAKNAGNAETARNAENAPNSDMPQTPQPRQPPEQAPIKRLVALNTSECLWIYVLRVVSEKPVHAYALRKIIEERFGFTPGLVTAYKVLYLLESGGYVKTEPAGRITNYAITQKGKELLKSAAEFYRKQAKRIEYPPTG